jgi:eukaryotic-like serine/threonine-protein kinase
MVDWRRAYEVCAAVLHQEPAEREALLSAQCGDDIELRREVESLLAVAARDTASTATFLEMPSSEPGPLIGRNFGHFRLVERIGVGGMGVVFRAERTDGVPQSVAIKLLIGEVTPVEYARFEREARILAHLEHPAVARLIDTGVQDGRTWIALEYVRGKRIDTYCEESRLSLRERLGLLIQLTDAVSAAHRMLIVHRDIKPANVLVTEDGLPKLIDFGIGAMLTATDAERAPTVNAARMFTPHYSAPEQVAGQPVTVATDIFGLGALGYRLLTGLPPFPDAKGPLGYMLAVTQKDIDPSSVAALRAGKDSRVVDTLRGDLDAVLQKALARDPTQRYATAPDLRADLQRYLDQEPVVARRPTLGYRLQKFARRHAVPVSAAVLLLLGATTAGVIYALQARSVAQAREMAAQRGRFLETLLTSANPSGGRRDVMVGDLLDKVMKQSDREISPDPLVTASVLGVVARTEKGLGHYGEAKAANDRQLALVRQHGGSGEDLVDALNLQSLLLFMTGHALEAEAPTRETLALLDDECKANGEYADTLDILGEIQASMERDDEADATYRRELACTRQFHDDRSSERRAVHALNNIMVLNRNRGRASDALAAGREAVDLAKKAFPPAAPYLLTTELNLADTMAMNRLAVEAEPLIRRVIADRTRVLGPQHTETLMAGTSLARDLHQQQRYAEAASTGLSAASALEEVLGVEHPVTLNAWQVYGNAACHAGQTDEGLKALRRSREQTAKRLGPNAWQILSINAAIGSCLAVLHRHAEAEPLLRAAAQGLEASRGDKFYITQAAFADLRDLYADTGDAASAAWWAAKIRP